MTIGNFAMIALSQGFSVVPPRQDGSKAPITSWGRYQNTTPSREEVTQWYSDGELTGIGYVCGKVSGGLEVIDFDDRSVWTEYRKLCAEIGLGDLLDRVSAGYLEHSPNGAHLLYRCEEVSGNTRLATSRRKTLIETRGEGGYIIVAPSSGAVNQSGGYDLLFGGPVTIETITAEERSALLNACRVFDNPKQTPARICNTSSSSGDRPGDEYANETTWGQVLQPHGWVPVGNRGQTTSWRRPGKKIGVSATTNHEGSDLLWVFSTSTEFEPEISYTKFGAYATLNHGGDMGLASRHLASLGYGSGIEIPDKSADLSGILAEFPDPETMEPDYSIDTISCPGVIGEITQWMIDSAIKPQPRLALGAAIATVSTVLGQRVSTPTDLRSNIYILGVAHTGSGKEHARQCVKRLFLDLGRPEMIGDSFASGAAVEVALRMSPVSLYMIDEIGHLFRSLRRDAPSYIHDIVPVLLSVYGESSSVHTCRTYASSEKNDNNVIVGPCLSLYGTTVPSTFYDSVTREQLANGLLSRFLVFESDDPDPHLGWPDARQNGVPSSVTAWCKSWLDFQGDGGDLAPSARVVGMTKAAKATFSRLETKLRHKRTEMRENGEDQGAYTRATATALKLALIRACGVVWDPTNIWPEVTEADADWGCRVAYTLTCGFAERLIGGIVESRAEENCKLVLDVVKANRDSGVSKNILTRRTKKLDRRSRNDAISTLLETGEITAHEERVGTSGRPATIYKC